MMLHDVGTEYSLHVQHFAPTGNDLSDTFGASAWNQALRAKVSFAAQFMQRAAPNALVLFTDLDVIPLGPYSSLVHAMPPSRELTWQYTRVGHMPANTGLYLMRNTPSVRDFLDVWLGAVRAGVTMRKDDQRHANSILSTVYDCPERDVWNNHNNLSAALRNFTTLNWHVWPTTLTSGFLRDATNFPSAQRFVAFHALGWGNTTDKLMRINAMLAERRYEARLKGVSSGVHAWQQSCNAVAESAACLADSPPPSLLERSAASPPSPPAFPKAYRREAEYARAGHRSRITG